MKLSHAYFDTSVLAKTYVKEPGSDRARQLVRTRQVITSSIAGLELISAFRRNLGTGSIAEKAHSAIVRRFQQDREKLRIVELSAAVLQDAEKVVADFDVRSLDAVHIASAMISRGRFPKELPFITADARQREVAAQLGLKVIWVE